VKDWIEVAGLAHADRFGVRGDEPPREDATVVRRLRAAGAVLLGKSRAGISDDGPRNPHDAERSPGASSGGEAALVAAGASLLGIGSDSGGSLRWPAHCCGIATLKPGTGRVPNTGHFPPVNGLADPRTVIGPLTRRAKELEAVLRVLAAPDGVDPAAVPALLGKSADVNPTSLRVAVLDSIGDVTCDGATAGVLAAAAERLAAAGARVERAAPPHLDEALAITRAYWARPESLREDSWAPSHESTLSGDQIERSLFRWDRLRRAMLAFARDHDLVLCPVATTAAPPVAPPTAEDYRFTLPFSLSGWPVAVARAGEDGAGLPIGVQLAARPFEEHVALLAATIVEAPGVSP
jgi:amidase